MVATNPLDRVSETPFGNPHRWMSMVLLLHVGSENVAFRGNTYSDWFRFFVHTRWKKQEKAAVPP